MPEVTQIRRRNFGGNSNAEVAEEDILLGSSNTKETIYVRRWKRWQQLWPNSLKYYKFLIALRVLLVFIPQTGYIHPDEFFQSFEIVSGDIFGKEIRRPWEFNSTQPIRCITLPYMTIGIPFWIFSNIGSLMYTFLGIDIATPYFQLVSVRLFICCLSFVCDICLYKICLLNCRRFIRRLTIFASCYVVIVYGTRTFSNTIEMILFSLLLYLVGECLQEQERITKFCSYVEKQFSKRETIYDHLHYKRIISNIPKFNLRYCYLISTICVIGCFNRPTFAAYAVSPIFYWLHRGFGNPYYNFVHYHVRMLALLACAIPTTIVLIVIDSFYYGYISIPEIMRKQVSINSFVVTPLNFLKYNSDVENLAQHGLHPRYLNFLVNIPLLFTLLAVVWYAAAAIVVWRTLCSKFNGQTRALSIVNLMIVSLIVPIFILSFFPHQEPRFLIPIILPLIYLHAEFIFNFDALKLIYYNRVRALMLYTESIEKRKLMLFLWFSMNLLLTIFYGFLHQGGVYSLALKMNNEIKDSPANSTVHLITSYAYSLPQSLVQAPSSSKLYKSSDGVVYKKTKKFYLYELGSKEIYDLVMYTSTVYSVNNEIKFAQKRDFKLYLALPSFFDKSLEDTIKMNKRFKFKIFKKWSIYPHVSTEVFSNSAFKNDVFTKIKLLALEGISLVQLSVYEIENF